MFLEAFVRNLIPLLVSTWSVGASRGQCGRLKSLPAPCRCSFDSLVICRDLKNSSTLDDLFKSIESGVVGWLDGIRLVNARSEAFAGLSPRVDGNVAKIQSFEIEDSELSRLTAVWDGQFWNRHDGTFSLVIRRTSGLETWNWTSVSKAFPSLQYLEIDRSPVRTLPEDFTLAFDQLLGLTITNSELRVLESRSLFCSMCKSIRLGFNRIEKIGISSIATQEGSTLHLDLRNNSLRVLPLGFFDNLALVDNLRVDLDGNQIESLQGDLFVPLRKLRRVDIRYVRGLLRCDCTLNHLTRKPFDTEYISCRESSNMGPDIALKTFLNTCSAKREF